MGREVRTRSILTFAMLLVAGAARGQQDRPGSACMQAALEPRSHGLLGLELRSLRLELLEFRIEKQAAAVAVLERARSSTDAKLKQLAEEEQSVPDLSAGM